MCLAGQVRSIPTTRFQLKFLHPPSSPHPPALLPSTSHLPPPTTPPLLFSSLLFISSIPSWSTPLGQRDPPIPFDQHPFVVPVRSICCTNWICPLHGLHLPLRSLVLSQTSSASLNPRGSRSVRIRSCYSIANLNHLYRVGKLTRKPLECINSNPPADDLDQHGDVFTTIHPSNIELTRLVCSILGYRSYRTSYSNLQGRFQDGVDASVASAPTRQHIL